MLRALRGLRIGPGVIVATLVAFLTVNVSAALHDSADDTLCDDAMSATHAGPEHVGRPSSTPRSAQHCMVCHAVQTRAEQAGIRYTPPAANVSVVATTTPDVVPFHLVCTQPARAPPLTSLP
jgi:hypothetical protein